MTFIMRANEGTKTCQDSYSEDICLNLKYFSKENSVNKKLTDFVDRYKLNRSFLHVEVLKT